MPSSRRTPSSAAATPAQPTNVGSAADDRSERVCEVCNAEIRFRGGSKLGTWVGDNTQQGMICMQCKKVRTTRDSHVETSPRIDFVFHILLIGTLQLHLRHHHLPVLRWTHLLEYIYISRRIDTDPLGEHRYPSKPVRFTTNFTDTFIFIFQGAD